MAGALIITAEIAPRDFAWVDYLRRVHYPAERNRVPAHLTMFHALPPSAEREVRSTLATAALERPPRASVEGLMDLGGGVAFRVVSEDLDRVRGILTERFYGLLGAQDAGGWRPHITIQNKVPAKEARALLARIRTSFRPQPLAISGLGLHRYCEGPWEEVALYPFRGR
jgi:hypothetical protein